MDRKLDSVNNAKSANETLARRTWMKPEAKAAEVAKATLGAGGPNGTADKLACAS